MTRRAPIPETVTLHVPFRIVTRGGRKKTQVPDFAVQPRRSLSGGERIPDQTLVAIEPGCEGVAQTRGERSSEDSSCVIWGCSSALGAKWVSPFAPCIAHFQRVERPLKTLELGASKSAD